MPRKPKTDDPQKEALCAFLQEKFGQVERERKFDWLLAPSNCHTPSDYPVDYRKIVKSLCDHRGRTDFCNVRPCDANLPCDFVVANRKLIIEYDERQHFTTPRKIALRNYPPDVVLRYSATDWMKYCDEIDAHDNDPVYRDERRALYDSVRDIEAFRNGWTLLRIKVGEINWETATVETLNRVLNRGRRSQVVQSATRRKPMSIQTPSGCNREHTDMNQKPPTLDIRKLGIVARNYRTTGSFKKFLPDVLRRLDKEGCDAVLFSLLSLPVGYDPRNDPRKVFQGLKNIKTVFVEECRKERGAEIPTGKEFFVYHHMPSGWKEYRLKQRFSTGKSEKKIREFVQDEMPRRFLGNCFVLLCGESNGVKCKREDGKVHDVFGLRATIPEKVRVILNPIHDYMKRHEMKKKRAFLSKGKRWVISIWCKGKPGEHPEGVPWTVFYNGIERDVDEIVNDFEVKGVYVGVLDIG